MKNNKLLVVIILSYVILLLFIPEKGIQSLENSLYYIKEMLIIMPVILLLTSLIEAWVPKEAIQNALGEKSGVKGFIFSFLLGSFSAGPIYAAFPICKTLLKKGAGIANIIIILSSWAVIKIPMLANESKFLGPKFMLVRWILTTISILIISVVSARLVKKGDLPVNSIKERADMRLSIDESFCIGCGVCVRLSPEDFIVENKRGKVRRAIFKDQKSESIKLAIEQCPAKVIYFR